MFSETISVDDVGYEAVILEHDEIDKRIISKNNLKRLPNPLHSQMYICLDSNENEWLVVIVINELNGTLL